MVVLMVQKCYQHHCAIRQARYPCSLSRNFRKLPRIGSHATGDIIVTMDADLQDDPAEIPRFLEALKQFDLVVGWKYNRKDPSITKKIPSKIFNLLNRWLFGLTLHDSDCGFRAMKVHVAKGLNLYGDVFRYIPALVKRQGFSVGEIKVQHHERRWGKSKYGFKRLLTGPFDLLTIKFMTEYNQRPLHLFGLGGLFFFSIGFIVGLYLLYVKYVRGDLLTPRTPLMLFSILLIVLGIQLVGIGLIGEMIVSQQKDERFIIKK